MQITLGLKSLSLTNQNVKIQALWISVFTSLTAVGAWLEIPTQPVPFTLQTFFVLLSGALIGARNGAISQIAYLALGSIGLPVFAGFSFGFAKIIGLTGGYLLSFPVAAFVVGYLINLNKSYLWVLLSMTIGMLVIFTLGTLFLNFVYLNDWKQSITSGFFIFTWWDTLKIFAAASIYYKLQNKN
ncbi:MAG: biotin transporter BioY [Bacteroidota bacterium]|nr:biotin transporter BioY [Bacteroidota bacterium]